MLNQQLEHYQLQALAELAEHTGYMVLLDGLLADLDDLLDRVRAATSDIEELRAVREWRALDGLVSRLRTLPVWAAEQRDQAEVNVPDTTISEFPGDLSFSPEEQMTVMEKMGLTGQALPRTVPPGWAEENVESTDSV